MARYSVSARIGADCSYRVIQGLKNRGFTVNLFHTLSKTTLELPEDHNSQNLDKHVKYICTYNGNRPPDQAIFKILDRIKDAEFTFEKKPW